MRSNHYAARPCGILLLPRDDILLLNRDAALQHRSLLRRLPYVRDLSVPNSGPRKFTLSPADVALFPTTISPGAAEGSGMGKPASSGPQAEGHPGNSLRWLLARPAALY